MRAYLIDPGTQTTTEIDVGETNEDMYEVLQCSTYELIARVVGLAMGDALFVDQEPFLTDKRRGFRIKGVAAFIRGRGLICGHTADGDMCDARTKLAQLKKIVLF